MEYTAHMYGPIMCAPKKRTSTTPKEAAVLICYKLDVSIFTAETSMFDFSLMGFKMLTCTKCFAKYWPVKRVSKYRPVESDDGEYLDVHYSEFGFSFCIMSSHNLLVCVVSILFVIIMFFV